jgi:hypothetical protein
MSCLPNRAPQVTATDIWNWTRPSEQSPIPEYSDFPTNPIDKQIFKHTGQKIFFQYDSSKLEETPPEDPWVPLSSITGDFQVPLIPTGAAPLQILDTKNPGGLGEHSGAEGSLFLVYVTDNNPILSGPLLMTDRGLIVKKDFFAGGFLDSGQGALWLNYGLHGKPDLSSPPLIQMMSSEVAYPSGSSFPTYGSNPLQYYQKGQLFNLTSAITWAWNNHYYPAGKYMWDGYDWVSGNFNGNYDTLFLLKYDGITPAHLNLSTLTFGARTSAAKMVLGGSDYGYYDQSSNWHYYDNLFLVKANGTTPGNLNAGSVYAEHIYARGTGSSNGAHLWSSDSNNFSLATQTSSGSPAWKIGYGNGSGDIDTGTGKPWVHASGNEISFFNFNIRANHYYDENGGSNATFHGNVTGNANYATTAGSCSTATNATNASYATTAGSSSSASAIPVLSSDPSSPATGSIWLKT